MKSGTDSRVFNQLASQLRHQRKPAKFIKPLKSHSSSYALPTVLSNRWTARWLKFQVPNPLVSCNRHTQLCQTWPNIRHLPGLELVSSRKAVCSQLHLLLTTSCAMFSQVFQLATEHPTFLVCRQGKIEYSAVHWRGADTDDCKLDTRGV